MDEKEQRIKQAIDATHIVRPPRQTLATFGETNIHYYLLTEPAYAELQPQPAPETVLREGHVIAQRPQIVTPFYMNRLEGFGEDARRYFGMMAQRYGANAPGLLYTYKNEPQGLSILSGTPPEVAERIGSDIDARQDKLAAIIYGLDDMWDVSLFRFIYELTERSLGQNVGELQQHGLLGVDSSGVPAEARFRIGQMFWEVKRGELSPAVLKEELDRWGLFEEYQDRFFALFRH